MSEQLQDKNTAYSDLSAQGLRNLYNENDRFDNFWNKPLPDSLLTVNGNKAYFNKSWNKTHTAFYQRKCALKVEVTLADGSVRLVDIGTFLMQEPTIDDSKINIALEDLAKPLMEEPADSVKSGFQWYRNVPVKFLVEELIKTVYYDKRNGEVPRDFIIDDIRPVTPTALPTLSSLGKPPSFSRLSNSLDEDLKCRVLCKANINSLGENLYMGLNAQLWAYNDLAGTYSKIGEIIPAGTIPVYIQKLWFNATDNFIYGIALEEEQLVYSNDKVEYGKYECQVGVNFVFFKADRESITVLFDSQSQSSNYNFKYSIYPGKYHIIPPYFKLTAMSQADYKTIYGNTYHTYKNTNFRLNPVLSGIGNFDIATQSIKNLTGDIYKFPQTENIAIPFAQKVGFIANRYIENYLPAWYGAVEDPGANKFRHAYFGHNRTFPETTGNRWVNNQIYVREYAEDDPYFNTRPSECNPVYSSPIYNFRDRTRIVIQGRKTLTETADKYYYAPTEGYSQQAVFIVQTKDFILDNNNPTKGFNRNSAYFEENYDSNCPSIDYYNIDNPFSYLPNQFTAKTFYPGYFSWYEEALLLKDSKLFGVHTRINPEGISWPWLKYTSGQKGSIEYLPTLGISGSFFIQVLDKVSRRSKGNCNFSQADLNTQSFDYNTGEMVPETLRFKYFIYDLALNTFTEVTLSDMVQSYSGVNVPLQITATAVNGTTLFIAGMSFNNQTDTDGVFTSEKHNKTRILKVDFSSSVALPTITVLYESNYSKMLATITDMLYTSNGLIISYYDRKKIVTFAENAYKPSLGTPFGLAKLTNLSVSVDEFSDLNPLYSNHFINGKYQFSRLIKSSIDNYLYYVLIHDRDESTNKMELRRYDLVTETEDRLGFISDITFGDTNILSNLELQELVTGFNTVFGVSTGYLPNYIKKSNSKNYLFKYDKYLSGVVELADFNNLKVWDALSQIARAFNYIMGFDNDKFFFIKRELENEASIFIDLDLDPVISKKKILDVDIKNVITATPMVAKKGDIEWNVTLCSNMLTTQVDDGRTNLDISLRIRQEDDMAHDIVLKTVVVGSVPNVENEYKNIDPTNVSNKYFTNVRFAYLIYNVVFETKLYRDVASNETEIYLPSFFGSNLSDQLSIGDIFVVNYTDTEGNSQQISRMIIDADFSSNIIILEENLGQDFAAYTPVSIFRSNAIKGDDNKTTLSNNTWSDKGVTFISTGVIQRVAGTTYNLSTDIVEFQVASFKNLGIGTVIRISDLNAEYQIYAKKEYVIDNKSTHWIQIIPFNNSILPTIGTDSTLINKSILAYWVPKGPSTSNDSLVEVGGSKIFVGFEYGSTGVFWQNPNGYDYIEIKAPGLQLEANSSLKYTAVNQDSIYRYGKKTEDLPENRFMQRNFIEYATRLMLFQSAFPRLIFEIKNLIQAQNVAGESYNLPFFKIVSTTDSKLTKVTIRSKKYLPNFKDYSTDFYLMSHDFNLKDFSQNIKVKGIDPF